MTDEKRGTKRTNATRKPDVSFSDTIKYHIESGTSWNGLPEDIRHSFGAKEKYIKEVTNFSYELLYKWENSPTKKYLESEDVQRAMEEEQLRAQNGGRPEFRVTEEMKQQRKSEYYMNLINYCKNKLRIYPYKFASVLITKFNIFPFDYYKEMVHSLMKSEKSYDTLPNFTAADVFRLMKIGRNQYIDIMNKVRAPGRFQLWKNRKNTVKAQLPTEPIQFPIEYWWRINGLPMGRISDFNNKVYPQLSDEQQVAVGLILSQPLLETGLTYPQTLHPLYKQKLIFYDVPVDESDFIIVPPLQNFIMNRQPNDPFEKLLYDILVTIDERTTVSELAHILEKSLDDVKAAISILLRLQFAKKKFPLPTDEFMKTTYMKPWFPKITDYHKDMTFKENVDENQGRKKRICFLYDSTLAAYLMMGNLGVGLKDHAVTLFEVGKMLDENIDALMKELEKIEFNEQRMSMKQGDAQQYYVNAINLRKTLQFLRYNESLKIEGCDGGVDMIRCESLSLLEPSTKIGILQSHYALLVAMAPLAPRALSLPTSIPRFYGPSLSHFSSPWFRLYLYHCAESGPKSILIPKGRVLTQIPDILKDCVKNSAFSSFYLWDSEVPHVQNTLLLQILNENLVRGPVLVSALEGSSKREEILLSEVAFPFTSPANENEDEATPTSPTLVHIPSKQQSQVELIMKRLSDKMHLDVSLGIVSLSPRNYLEPEGEIIPINMTFGIPLSNSKSNREVLQIIQDRNLFSMDSINQHSQNTHQLVNDFLNFIEKMLGDTFRMSEIIYPSRPIVFDGKQIVVLENEDL